MLIKKSLDAFSPVELSMLRVSLSAIAFLPFGFKYLKNTKWADWKSLIIIGLTGNALPAFLYALAQTNVDSSVAGILNGMTPIFTLLFAVIIFRKPFYWRQLIGIVLGFAGVVLLVLLGNDGGGKTTSLLFPLFILLATMCYGISGNMVEQSLSGRSPIYIAALSVISVSLPCLLILFSGDFVQTMTHDPAAWEAFFYVSFLALVNTVFASVLFYKLVQISGAVFSSSVTYLIPIVALALGFLDGELIIYAHIISIVLIVAGVYYSRNVKA